MDERALLNLFRSLLSSSSLGANAASDEACRGARPHESGEYPKLGVGPFASRSSFIGRLPAGLRADEPASAPRAMHPMAAFMARTARLEAASIAAFERLAGELAHHAAPVDLVRRAQRAARDEMRHASVLAAIARHYGEEPAPAEVDELPTRALEAIAIENAVEGCVRQTFGALVASWQARAASDRAIAAAMRGIARDETRHAALAWAIDRWAKEKLDLHAYERVERARSAAVDRLRRELATEPPAVIAEAGGLPRARDAALLMDGMTRALWAA